MCRKQGQNNSLGNLTVGQHCWFTGNMEWQLLSCAVKHDVDKLSAELTEF